MDLQIFQAINDFAGRWHVLDQVGIFVASRLPYVIVAVLIGLWFVRKGMRRMIVVGFASAVSARVIVEIIRHFYHRVRPVPVEALHRLVVNTEWSFPSGHAAFFFALATGVFLYNKKLGVWYYIFAALIGIARIFIGVHWPSDILVGAALGMVTALGVDAILRNRFPWLER